MSDVLRDRNRLQMVEYLVRNNPDMDQILQNFVSLTSKILDVDYTGVHFLTDSHQEVKAYNGLDLPRLKLENSVCQYTLKQKDALVIQDLSTDSRTADFWYVKDKPSVKSYAGVPLQTDEGALPGTLCLLDKESRDYSETEIGVLSSLADEVIEKLQMNASLSKFQKQAEKTDWMIREIHHRLKNNLAVVSGLMDLEAMRVEHPETKKVLEAMQHRLTSIANVHRQLYESESYEDLNLLEYSQELVKNINKNYNRDNDKVNYRVEGEPFTLGEDKAVTFGLLVNELVTNAYKHAFKEGGEGHICITLLKGHKEGDVKLIVEDNGQGMPEDFDSESEDTLGFQLFQSLVNQLQGSYTLDTEPGEGTRIEVAFSS